MTDGLLPVPRPRGRFPRIIQATFQLPLCLYWVLLFDVDDVGVESSCGLLLNRAQPPSQALVATVQMALAKPDSRGLIWARGAWSEALESGSAATSIAAESVVSVRRRPYGPEGARELHVVYQGGGEWLQVIDGGEMGGGI